MSIDNETLAAIDRAVAFGFVSLTQADFLKEELEMFPISGSALAYMVKKGLLTADQLKELENAPATPAPPPPAEVAPQPPGISGGLARPAGPIAGAGPTAHATPPPAPQPQPQRPTVDSLFPPSPSLPSTQRSQPPPSPQPPPQKMSIADALNASRQAMQSPTPARPAMPQPGTAPGTSPGRPLSPQTPIARPISASPSPSTVPPRPSAGQPQPRPAGISTPGTAAGSISPAPQLRELFKAGRDRECSDLHLTVGKPPYLRHQGKLFFLPEEPLTAATVKPLVYSVLTPEQQQLLEKHLQLDFSFEVAGLGRYRANVYRQRLGWEGVFRFIPTEVPTLKALNFPSVLETLTTYPQGLNLVTGPGGCGKTTTVAAMLELINATRREHIITVEDPVEYVFQPKQCQITQREVGTHTNSFPDALRTALRQDPDVIMIGELRDLETTSIAITAAETGHLVFGTLHTAGAVRTVARVLDVYPPNQRQQICMMVAESLRGIISQQLLPRKDGQGRACAMEILVVTTGVSQVIKEGKTHQLVSHMQSGRKLGMKSMDDALMELAQGGIISGAVAYAYADNKPAFELLRNS